MNQPQVRKGGILVAVASAIIYSGVSVLAKFAYRYNLSPGGRLPHASCAETAGASLRAQ